jgi:type I restriction enzyme S subunit
VTAETRSAFVPKLRFPQFKDKPSWKLTELSQVAQFVNDRVSVSAIAKDEYVGTENILPDFSGIAAPSSFPASGSITPFRVNDVLISNIRPYLKKVWRATRSGGASNDVLVVRSKSEISDAFLASILQSDAFIDYVMAGAKGVKMPRGDIGLIRDYPVGLPEPAEQQKIADCLASVRGLMAAEGRKLEALRQHKKGLIHQLYPQPGEAVPSLRFPEFRYKGEWKERKAGDLFLNRINKGEDGLPIYSVTMHDGMVRRDTLDRNYYDIEEAAGNKKALKNDIAYNMMRMWQGALGVAPEDCLVSPAYIVLVPQPDVVSKFFEYLFKLPTSLQLLTSYSRGLTKDRLRLYYEDFARIPLRCPSEPEQQRVADCLSSLDTHIAGQARRLDVLSQHMRALLQQLLPSKVGMSE